MLRKLLKYEFRDTAHVIPFLYLAAVLFAVISVIANQIDIDWFRVTSSVILIIVGVAVVIVTFVVIVMRFYKNLYLNEGYLMFSLPVKPYLLLVSKVTAAFSWIILSFSVFFGTLCVALYYLGGSSELSEIMTELEKYGLEKIIYLLIPMMLFAILYLLSQIFFAITVGNRPALQGFGAASGFVVFLVMYVALKIFESVATIFVPFSLKLNFVEKVNVSFSTQNMFGYLLDSMKGIEPSIVTIGLGGFIFDVIMICVLFYLTGRIMNKKVSLR